MAKNKKAKGAHRAAAPRRDRDVKGKGKAEIDVAQAASSARSGELGGRTSKVVKRLAKRAAFVEKLETVLRQRARAQQPFNTTDLSAALQTADAASATTPLPAKSAQFSKVRRNKAKRAVSAQEMEHLGLVMAHPAFQAAPVATIREHLQNTTRPAPPT